MAAARGTAKVLQKLEKSVGAGNYYEAHQMYRTVANRYVKAQNYKDAIDLLHSGSLLLLKHDQAGSGADLGLYLLEVYNHDKVAVTEESRDRIFDIADLMGPENSQRRSFLQNAIKYGQPQFVAAPATWSGNNGEYNNGDPLIQHYVGLLYWKEKNYEQAEQHLLVGTKESAEALGLVLFEWSEVTPGHDKGAYLLRGVLQELSMRNLRDANLMTTIGELFFGIKPVRQANMLADLMSSLFSGPPPSSQQPAISAGSALPPQPAIEEMD
ncbi:hypothetical protein BGX26_010832 [Mortierella sp. AD094]|nr:hypothetical protein BGX26_010832 [Mortierella sp. AD094]